MVSLEQEIQYLSLLLCTSTKVLSPVFISIIPIAIPQYLFTHASATLERVSCTASSILIRIINILRHI